MNAGVNRLVQGLAILILGAGLAAGVMGFMRSTQPAPIHIEPPPPTATPMPWQVYVSGAVNDPGVYVVEPGMIVEDVIRLAGGFTDEADRNLVNLALRVRDELQVVVPAVGEVVALPTAPVEAAGEEVDGNAAATPTSPAIVNINTATLEELDTLPGIGPSTAQNILDYRTQNGPFAQIEDIMNVSGIGEGRFNDIKALITVGESGNEGQ